MDVLMKRRDVSVETEFHPTLTAFLFVVNELYNSWGSELIITSGSEHTAIHSNTSLHYNIPAQATDIRIWQTANTPLPEQQHSAIVAIKDKFCRRKTIPITWIDIILEKDHIHIEFQPKRV